MSLYLSLSIYTLAYVYNQPIIDLLDYENNNNNILYYYDDDAAEKAISKEKAIS
jgi:hypothetical protein